MREVDLDTFATALAADATVVDVREPDEYEAGHVAGARLIPLGELTARAGELPRTEPVYIICAGGARSLSAAKYLAQAGFDARSVAGGTSGWQRSGRPVVTGAQRPA